MEYRPRGTCKAAHDIIGSRFCTPHDGHADVSGDGIQSWAPASTGIQAGRSVGDFVLHGVPAAVPCSGKELPQGLFHLLIDANQSLMAVNGG